MGGVSSNPYENESLEQMIKNDFIDEAQDPETGIIKKQTDLN